MARKKQTGKKRKRVLPAKNLRQVTIRQKSFLGKSRATEQLFAFQSRRELLKLFSSLPSRAKPLFNGLLSGKGDEGAFKKICSLVKTGAERRAVAKTFTFLLLHHPLLSVRLWSIDGLGKVGRKREALVLL
jgi:hypothetical protein